VAPAFPRGGHDAGLGNFRAEGRVEPRSALLEQPSEETSNDREPTATRVSRTRDEVSRIESGGHAGWLEVHELASRPSPFDEHVEGLGVVLTRYESVP
jgi:hypothetical protein